MVKRSLSKRTVRAPVKKYATSIKSLFRYFPFILVFGVGWGLFGMISSAWSRIAQDIDALFVQWGFRAHYIYVVGRDETTSDELKAIFGDLSDRSIFSLNLGGLREKLGQLPWVEDAQIRRFLPDTLVATVTERAPIAIWQQNQRHQLIDSAGRSVTSEHLEKFRHLPVLVGENAPKRAVEFLKTIEKFPVLNDQLEAASLISDRRWDLQLKSGLVIRLPDKNMDEAMRTLAKSSWEAKFPAHLVRALDLRVPGQMIVEWISGPQNVFPQDKQPLGKGRI